MNMELVAGKGQTDPPLWVLTQRDVSCLFIFNDYSLFIIIILG